MAPEEQSGGRGRRSRVPSERHVLGKAATSTVKLAWGCLEDRVDPAVILWRSNKHGNMSVR